MRQVGLQARQLDRVAGCRIRRLCSATALGLALMPIALHAQRLSLLLRGDTGARIASPGAHVALPVILDMSVADSMSIARVAARIMFDPTRLAFDSVRATGFDELSAVTDGAVAGVVELDARRTIGTTRSANLAVLHFTAATIAGAAPVLLTPTAAVTDEFVNVLALVRRRGVDVCVTETAGLWGDVNGDSTAAPSGDGAVNIIDAQQIARYAVGLIVQNARTLPLRGDVNGDAAVNIIDAQQIARFTVGLPAAPRIGVVAFTPPAVSSIVLSAVPSAPMPVGSEATVSARSLDAVGADVTPCAPVSWTSSNTAIASVAIDGVVSARGSGSATISARSEGRVSSVVVSVSAPGEPQLAWARYYPATEVGDGLMRDLILDPAGIIVAGGTFSERYRTGSERAVALSVDGAGAHRWLYRSDSGLTAGGTALSSDGRTVLQFVSAGGVPTVIRLGVDGTQAGTTTCPELSGRWVTGAGTVQDNVLRFGVGGPPAIVTADFSGLIDCAHFDSVAFGGLPSESRMIELAPLGNRLVLSGDYRFDNDFWYGMIGFIQLIDGAASPVWRTSLRSLLSPRVTNSSPLPVAVGDVDGQPAIYLATAAIFNTGTSGYSRYLTARLDASGNPLWLDQWDGGHGPSSCTESYPYVVLPDPRGGFIMLGMGSVDCVTAWDCSIASYRADGVRRWTFQPVFKGNGNNNCSAAALSVDGMSLYVTGETGPTFRERQETYIAKFVLPP